MEFLLEVGCEEIPARYVKSALEALQQGFLARLRAARLDRDGQITVHTMGTPRRLVLRADSLPDRQGDLDEQILGPKVEAAFDQNGKPTQTCMGFVRGRGVNVADLIKVNTPKGQVVAVKKKTVGLPTGEVLPGLVEDLVANLPFPKTMRWGNGKFLFARPIHWLLVLFNNVALEVSLAGVQSGRFSRGHRFTTPEPFEVETIDTYQSALRERDVLVDPEERQKLFMKEATRLAAEVGGRLVRDPSLEEEITFLTEMPVPLLGRFDGGFLALPRQVLVAAMRNHQRYFSVESDEGKLLNAFVAVGNTPVEEPQIVRHGNERVLAARLNDARFFFDADRKVSLTDLVPRLQGMIFQADLGTYYEKAHRMGNLALVLAKQVGLGKLERPSRLIDALTIKIDGILSPEEQFSWRVARASLLSKADLLTEMVAEFPELQGEMGGVYVLQAGEDERVAKAVREHYWPRFSGDAIPERDEGALISIADRLDTLAGCFGVGLRPTGAADPYGLRRQCLGVINIVIGKGYELSLRWMIEHAILGLHEKIESALLRKVQARAQKEADRKKKKPVAVSKVEPFEKGLLDDLAAFFAGRLRQRLAEAAPMDVVDAVLEAGMDDMTEAALRVRALADFAKQPAFEDLVVAFKRVANIIKGFEGAELDPALFVQPEEIELHRVYLSVAPAFARQMHAKKFSEGMELLAKELRPPVDRFFEKVLVNDPHDPRRQHNRKALLGKIAALFGRIADFTRLQSRESR